jgi:hypothetical protein
MSLPTVIVFIYVPCVPNFACLPAVTSVPLANINLAVTGVPAVVDLSNFASSLSIAGVLTVADIPFLLVFLLVAAFLLMVCLLLMGYCCWHPSLCPQNCFRLPCYCYCSCPAVADILGVALFVFAPYPV